MNCPKCNSRMVRDCALYFCLHCGREIPAEGYHEPPATYAEWPRHHGTGEKHTKPLIPDGASGEDGNPGSRH